VQFDRETAAAVCGDTWPEQERMPTTLDATAWLERHGDVLYRFALARVGDETQAEDLVQETLLAALQARARYAGGASERTWLIGILKHKLVDFFRKSSRESAEEFDEDTALLNMEGTFDARGHWQIEVSHWAEPERSLEQTQFWHALAACVERLPPRLALLFTLREVDGVETGELCETMQITNNNLWVMLSRMRLQLRNCLDVSWFGKPA
jgi:RNA polymerase sigma-70 factor (ECF subfamily)